MKLKDEQVIFKALAGSRLYGTDHPGSDHDLKMVFAHDLDGLILGSSDTDRTKDEVANSEAEYFSLKKFATLLNQNQTVAIELLFIPDDKVIKTSPAWDSLLELKDKIVSKNIMPFIGYARNQARIYSNKGDRLGFLRKMKKSLHKVLINQLPISPDYP